MSHWHLSDGARRNLLLSAGALALAVFAYEAKSGVALLMSGFLVALVLDDIFRGKE